MLVELNNAVFNIRHGSTEIIAETPKECPYCHRMTHFFTNTQGMTRCTGCPALRKDE